MTVDEIDKFEKVQAQLEGLYNEISSLSKKKPDDAINKFKLKFINSVLSSVGELLKDKYQPFPDFEQFDENEIPTNSDVVFMLSQFLHSLEKLRSDNIIQAFNHWCWKIDGKESSIRTAPPRKLSNK